MRIDYMDSINACAAHYGEDAEAMRAFLIAGHEKAVQMENRGPIVFDEAGKLASHILDAYREHGFYVFTGVLKQDELKDIEEDLEAMKQRFLKGRERLSPRTDRPGWVLTAAH